MRKQETGRGVARILTFRSYETEKKDIAVSVEIPTIEMIAEDFQCITGLSDHTMGSAVAVAGVALGAKVVEKHLTLNRADGGPDGAFSMEPREFKEMVDNIRIAEKAMGTATYDLTRKQKNSREHSRSLFVVQDMKKGDIITEQNVRSIRPSCGLHTRYYESVLGKKVNRDLELGTPMSLDFLEDQPNS